MANAPEPQDGGEDGEPGESQGLSAKRSGPWDPAARLLVKRDDAHGAGMLRNAYLANTLPIPHARIRTNP
jgi:hypothetical protein